MLQSHAGSRSIRIKRAFDVGTQKDFLDFIPTALKAEYFHCRVPGFAPHRLLVKSTILRRYMSRTHGHQILLISPFDILLILYIAITKVSRCFSSCFNKILYRILVILNSYADGNDLVSFRKRFDIISRRTKWALPVFTMSCTVTAEFHFPIRRFLPAMPVIAPAEWTPKDNDRITSIPVIKETFDERNFLRFFPIQFSTPFFACPYLTVRSNPIQSEVSNRYPADIQLTKSPTMDILPDVIVSSLIHAA